ncbi:hypothetical protein [Lacinutrix sp.]
MLLLTGLASETDVIIPVKLKRSPPLTVGGDNTLKDSVIFLISRAVKLL